MYNLDELELLEKKATPVPLKFVPGEHGHFIEGFNPKLVDHPFYICAGLMSSDGLFLVELRNAAPEMFAEIRKLRAENEHLNWKLASIRTWIESS